MTQDEMKQWINNATYEQLLRKWRFGVCGDPFFQGEVGQYYSSKLAEKRVEVGPAEAVRASKSIGW